MNTQQIESDIPPIYPGPHKGGTRKIGDLPESKICTDPEHNPANMIVWEPGTYEHTCPSCGATQRFGVPHKPTC